jgi:prophage maintenance system killer protein
MIGIRPIPTTLNSKHMTTTINPIQIYQAANGELEILIDQTQDTIWLTQEQIAIIFDVQIPAIAKHIKNIYVEEELEKNSTLSILEIVQKEGNRSVLRKLNQYNLDMILSVGYRINSKKATKFRQWANTVLKDYLVKGYSLNKKLISKHQEQTLEFLAKSATGLEAQDTFISILKQYTGSLVMLNQYDENRIESKKGNESIKIEIGELREFIAKAKSDLIDKNEATDLFGKEYEGKFEGTISAVYQGFGGVDVYPTAEEKAANLLYLIIKNHGFVDGNKRIGSILFIYFLNQNKILQNSKGEFKITENTLVALALLVAQSNPDDKEILIKLIIKLLAG